MQEKSSIKDNKHPNLLSKKPPPFNIFLDEQQQQNGSVKDDNSTLFGGKLENTGKNDQKNAQRDCIINLQKVT